MNFSIFQKNKSLSDEELAAEFRMNSDMQVIGELYHRYMDMVMGLCMKYFRDVPKSEDAVMEIFEIVVRRLPHHEVDHWKAWLYRVASNHCLDILRREKRIHEKDTEYNLMQNHNIDRHDIEMPFNEISETEEKLLMLEDCIGQLNGIQEKAVSLFYLEKQSYEAVSTELGISWSQTRSNIQNGRRNLKKCMESKS